MDGRCDGGGWCDRDGLWVVTLCWRPWPPSARTRTTRGGEVNRSGGNDGLNVKRMR